MEPRPRAAVMKTACTCGTRASSRRSITGLRKGRLTEEQVARLKALPLRNQIAEVLELEKSGIYFSKDLSKSILYSIAAPGTSQHIAMLAFDVNEFDNPRVREILAKHGWFQTVLERLATLHFSRS